MPGGRSILECSEHLGVICHANIEDKNTVSLNIQIMCGVLSKMVNQV